MAKVLYHQEAGDTEMDARADIYEDPSNPEAGTEPSVSLFLRGKKIVTRAVEGEKVGQYSLIDPAIALKAEAVQVDAAGLENLASENAALREQVEAAKEATAEARADAGRLVSDAAAKAKAASEASAELERMAAENAALKAESEAQRAAALRARSEGLAEVQQLKAELEAAKAASSTAKASAVAAAAQKGTK